MAIAFPNIDPVILPIGGVLAISWYSLSYVVGILLGFVYCKYLIKRYSLKISIAQFDDFLTYLILGIIFGGRLGYVLIYDPVKYLSNPIEILKTYEGGMSFHGGLIGVLLVTIVFARNKQISFWLLADLISAAAPIGIALGRIANFINCELVGRVADFPLAVLFPPDFLPRHASQIYEALTEGVGSFIVISFCIFNYQALNRQGLVSGVFLLVYGISRIFCEFFRQPDYQLGFIFDLITMGQLLSIPFVIVGGILICLSSKKY